jgi:hypothetical protein
MTAFVLSMDLFFQNVFEIPNMFRIDGVSISGINMAVVFLVMSLFQYAAWHSNNYGSRRAVSFINGLLWFLFSTFITFGFEHNNTQNLNNYSYFVSSISNIWLYLRLGLLKNGIGKL